MDVIARSVREAGLIATTKRGSGAAEMTATDAVNLIIGANAVQSPRLAAMAVEQYRTFKQSPHGRRTTGSVFGRLAQADTLPDALTVLVEEAGNLDAMFVDWVQRSYDRPYDGSTDWLLKPALTVSFSAGVVDITYTSPNETLTWRFQPDVHLLMQGFYTSPGDGLGRRVTTTVLFPTFLAIHNALFGENETAAGNHPGASR